MISIIRYSQRLGDVVRCLPLARHLAAQGQRVFIECLDQYHGIFENVSYVRPLRMGLFIPADRVYDLEIWPNRYDAFRASGLTWWQFITGLYPEFAGLEMSIEFDRIGGPEVRAKYGLTEPYSLLCPFGYSQLHPVPLEEFFALQRGLWADGARNYILADRAQKAVLVANGWDEGSLLTAQLADLPALIRDAQNLLTINSAPDIIASAVRKSWHKIPEGNAQDDVRVPGQIIVARHTPL